MAHCVNEGVNSFLDNWSHIIFNQYIHDPIKSQNGVRREDNVKTFQLMNHVLRTLWLRQGIQYTGCVHMIHVQINTKAGLYGFMDQEKITHAR